ncbi:MbtH family protein [Kitasatospora acidiphila]|uniref:MbtH family protein n=1 Tax=Kitasatospora acidiphila TaxID=2567942 RepID=UPI003C748E5A
MTNLSDDSDANYLVLGNDEGQNSLRPVFVEVPAGWQTVLGEAPRRDCLGHSGNSWTTCARRDSSRR